jgi:hypothetical protein
MRKLLLAAVAGTAFALAGCSEKAPEAAPTEATESDAGMESAPASDAGMESAPAADSSSEAAKM